MAESLGRAKTISVGLPGQPFGLNPGLIVLVRNGHYKTRSTELFQTSNGFGERVYFDGVSGCEWAPFLPVRSQFVPTSMRLLQTHLEVLPIPWESKTIKTMVFR